MKVNGFDVPPSVVTVTWAVPVAPSVDGTSMRQLVDCGQAMVVVCPPNWAVIVPDGLRRLVPLMTST